MSKKLQIGLGHAADFWESLYPGRLSTLAHSCHRDVPHGKAKVGVHCSATGSSTTVLQHTTALWDLKLLGHADCHHRPQLHYLHLCLSADLQNSPCCYSEQLLVIGTGVLHMQPRHGNMHCGTGSSVSKGLLYSSSTCYPLAAAKPVAPVWWV